MAARVAEAERLAALLEVGEGLGEAGFPDLQEEVRNVKGMLEI